MGEEFSMGNALDLSGRVQELVQSQTQAAEQAKANTDQARGASANNKRAAWVKAHAAKLDAAKAAMDVRLAGAERNYATTKTLLNFSLKMFGYSVGAIGDQKSNAERARAAVENGASAQERLSKGGAHDKTMAKMLNFSEQKAMIDERRDGIKTELTKLQAAHANNEPWSIEDQQLAKSLRMEDMNLQRQGELVAGLAQAQANGAFSSTQIVAQAERWDKNADKGHANVNDYLHKVGFDSKQIAAMKEYSQLQEQANELRTERKELKTQLAGEGQKYDKTLEEKQDVFMGDLQTQLDTMMQDQEDVRRFASASRYVNAMEEVDRLKRQEDRGIAVDPRDMAKAQFEMGKGESEFDATRNRPMNERAGWEIFSTVVGDLFGSNGLIEQLRQINKNYTQAQAQLSAASEQAGNAMEQAKDMELS